MQIGEIIRKAIPDASDELCEHVLWGRTPFPAGPVTARDLYRAAHRYRRAEAAGRDLCDFCDNLVGAKRRWLCERCADALERAKTESTETLQRRLRGQR